MNKEILLGKSFRELQIIVAALNMPKFVAKQISKWIYDKKVMSVDEMTNISIENRTKISSYYTIGAKSPVNAQRSVDGTIKYLYSTIEDKYIETVYIPEKDRATLCISSQIGCKMHCKFCMTGRQGFSGNLTAAEIINQWYSLPERDKITNIVLMGMGEPLDNLDNVMNALEIFTGNDECAWSPHRITLSTCGIKNGLKRFIENSKCSLAISLHSPVPQQRSQLMPAEKAYPIASVVELLRNYDWSKQRRLSFEYIVFKDINDSQVYLKELVKLLRGLDCRINLIRFHAIPDSDLSGVNDDEMIKVRDYLTHHGLYSTIRASRGEDIFAACGMLSTYNEIEKNARKHI